MRSVATKTIKILPGAMQHPGLAEAKITIGKIQFSTPKFKSSKHAISVPINVDGKQKGLVEVCYRGHRTV